MSHSIDTILKPLAITVIIDHEVKEVEKTTFIEQARGLLEFFGYEGVSDEQMLKWFSDCRADLEDQLWNKGGNTLVLRALAAFKEDAECEAVYDAMITLSLCDKKFVTEESRLIKSAAAIYGYALPPRKVDRE